MKIRGTAARATKMERFFHEERFSRKLIGNTDLEPPELGTDALTLPISHQTFTNFRVSIE